MTVKNEISPTSVFTKLGNGRVRTSRDKAEAVIKGFCAGALATVDGHGRPHVAIVYAVVDKELCLYFSTQESGRKFHNLLRSPTVSIAFFDEVNLEGVRLTGRAEQVTNLECEQETLSELMAMRYGDSTWPIPPLQMYERGATNELAVFKVIPEELTYDSFVTGEAGRYQPFFEKVI